MDAQDRKILSVLGASQGPGDFLNRDREGVVRESFGQCSIVTERLPHGSGSELYFLYCAFARIPMRMAPRQPWSVLSLQAISQLPLFSPEEAALL